MNPALIPVILQLAQAIIAAAPSIAEGVVRVKAMIDALFTSKVIDASEQNATKLFVDGLAAVAELGVPPSAWQVKPNPI